MIEARGVHYRRGSAVLLRDVSLVAPAGELLALVGPNGAGKSTLLRTLAGELRPTAGEVRIGDRPVAEWDRRSLAQVRAVLSQSSELAFPLIAEDVVLLGRSPHVAARESLNDRVIVGLAMRATDSRDYADRTYPTLSGGERQRVHAARALAQVWEGPEPRALFLDEPTASLDLSHGHALLAFAQRVAADGCAVVCVLHDLNLALQYATKVAVLRRGELAAFGRPADVLSPALLADVFDVDALVVPHPALPCPFLVTRGARRVALSAHPADSNPLPGLP